jgi:hypothetical protein
MGKGLDPLRMRLSKGITAKCSTCCSTVWSRNSARAICILQMEIVMGKLLETVLLPPSHNIETKAFKCKNQL